MENYDFVALSYTPGFETQFLGNCFEEDARGADEYFQSFMCHFGDGILRLEKGWIKCIRDSGDYMKK